MSGARTGNLAVVVVILLALAASAVASDEGWVYVGASGGYSVIDVDSADISAGAVDVGFTSAQTSIDDTDFGWKVFGGYRINKHFAVEGSYVDFGEASFTTRTTGPDGEIDGKAEATAYGVDVLAIVRPVEWADIFVKVGGFYWDVDGKVASIVDGEAATGKDSPSGTDVKAGVGASFVLSEDVSLRLEAEGYFNVGDQKTTGQADIGFLSIGLNYGF